MRSYLIEGLEETQRARLAQLLTNMQLQGSMPDLFWLPIPQAMYTEIQQEHEAKCGPYVMAFEIHESSVQLELLVRAKNALHCNCVAYASPTVQMHMMRYVEELLEELQITL